MKEKLYLKSILSEFKEKYDYPLFKKVLNASRRDVVNEIKKSKLRGRGGAGFPTYKKLEYVFDKDNVHFIVNADEGEPGTFKDRFIIEKNPNHLLEGLLILAYAVEAKNLYIYIRGEYKEAIHKLEKAIQYLNTIKETFNYSFDISLVKGAGAYVCGDETSLINSIEGKRPNSRIKPPYPTEEGLYGYPTVVNNVETIANVPLIIRDGGETYAKIGTSESTGTKLVCLSGRIEKAGVYEIEFGSLTMRELIFDLGKGIKNGNKFAFVIPGGISTCVLTDTELDVSLDYESLKEIGTSFGSGAVIVGDEQVDIVSVARNVSDFFMNETCGMCYPCKEGNRQIHHLLSEIDKGIGTFEYLDLIREISNTTSITARCGLGQSAGNFITCASEKFRDQFLIKMKVGDPID